MSGLYKISFMAINKGVVNQLELTPGEAAAITLFDEVYTRQPGNIKKLLEQHDQVFTGDPNVDFLQVYQLSQDRQRYFNEDYAKMCEEAHYFSLGDMMDKVSSAIGKTVDIIKPVAGSALTIFAPVAGALANEALPGSGTAATGLATSFGSLLLQPKPAATPTPAQTVFTPSQTNSNTDLRPPAQTLLKNMTTDVTTTGKILGIPKMWFWISLSALILIIVIIIIIAVRKAKKKKLAAAGK